jgi:hypothetical protein
MQSPAPQALDRDGASMQQGRDRRPSTKTLNEHRIDRDDPVAHLATGSPKTEGWYVLDPEEDHRDDQRINTCRLTALGICEGSCVCSCLFFFNITLSPSDSTLPFLSNFSEETANI